jgi:RimJ/RimL family protein N-acetyltransferase
VVSALRAPTLSDGDVTLRGLVPSDIPALVEACRDPEIPRWTRVPSPYLREDAERFLAIAATEAATGEGIALAITAATRDRLIGTIGLMEIGDGKGEIGYWIAAPERGRGVATRAVALLSEWAHDELGLAELEILAHGDNRPSQRVAESAGFTDTGQVRSVARMPEAQSHGYKVYIRRAPAA